MESVGEDLWVRPKEFYGGPQAPYHHHCFIDSHQTEHVYDCDHEQCKEIQECYEKQMIPQTHRAHYLNNKRLEYIIEHELETLKK